MTEKRDILKRSVSIFIIIAMLLTLFTVPAAAKSKEKLSKTKLTITEGKSTTLKLSGTSAKAKWYVSGKKLVTIKTKGAKKHIAVIKAGSKAGTCYVKVKAGNKTLKCKVTVKALKPGPEPDPEEEFKEKELSGTSIDKTAAFKANDIKGKATDDIFKKAMTETSLKMLKYLCANEKDKNRNVLISPDSILTAMAMVECGARNNTLAEMEKAFGGISADDFDAYLYTLNKRITSSEHVKYHIANSIWYKDNKDDISVKDEFIQKNVDFFGAQIFEAPFSNDTLNDINNWVYNHTRGMIPSILDELNKDTVMILLNAIAFEGEWADKYYEGQIHDEQPFYNEDRTTVQKKVTMLKGKEDIYVTIGEAEGFIKPYAGNELAFLGLETPEGMTVDEFVQSLTTDDFINGYKEKSYKYDVFTTMPEFKYDYNTSLVDTLVDLGIHDAFNDFVSDFTGIAPPEQPLVISDVLHKTHIELDRNGTKAAAVTAVIVDKAASAPVENPKVFVDLNHPFVYAIIDVESGIPLFIGTVKTVK